MLTLVRARVRVVNRSRGSTISSSHHVIVDHSTIDLQETASVLVAANVMVVTQIMVLVLTARRVHHLPTQHVQDNSAVAEENLLKCLA